jgi:hypothetical protein
MGMPIAQQRLENQRLTRAGFRVPAGVVSWLGAVQAQEYGPAKWALALRMAGRTTDQAIERAVDRGTILRTHVLRPTWHFVAPADIRWMLELSAPQVHRSMATYHRQNEVDALLTRAASIFERALGAGEYLTRAELGVHLERAGIPAKGTRLALLAMYAELEGVICSGPRRGSRFTYALLADRAPGAKTLPRDEALAALARRYFRSHGPATIRDFVWWSGLKTADAKRGLEMIRARSHDVDGRTYWTIGRTTPARVSSRGAVHLLPIYDEFLVAYRDRAAVPQPASQSLGSFWHAVVSGGSIVGTWRTARAGAGCALSVTTLRSLTRQERAGLAQAVRRYATFLEQPVTFRSKQ